MTLILVFLCMGSAGLQMTVACRQSADATTCGAIKAWINADFLLTGSLVLTTIVVAGRRRLPSRWRVGIAVLLTGAAIAFDIFARSHVIDLGAW